MSPPHSPVVKALQSSDGNSIYAEAIGDPKNPPIVLIHGFGLSAAALDKLFFDDRLVERFYLVRFDMRGHGRSGMPDKADGYFSELYANDFATVASAFGLKKPIYVGWSYGATIAADICAHLPEDTLAGIVYMAGLPWLSLDMLGAVATPMVLGLIPGLTSATEVAQNRESKLAFIDSLFAHPNEVDYYTKLAWLGLTATQSPTAAHCVLSRNQDPTRLFEAGNRGLPLLVLHGANDTQIVGELVAKQMKPHFKSMDVRIIEGGSHALHFDFPDDVVEALSSFAQKVCGN
ncbi:uncharacterized protein FIBRA_00024 [Fibroporia radiculosa]|uniref:AB hydrolase-1 domain-containing protein n=1 Tax=Fibroporia radiculosa TaxID=599839 RepID=J7SBQ5_9APHY|nr:uncharacterized protein FIBRA_00024 [Fibroporia radiculosa]CCL98031.1 predicted protein [Fibroporia radiculosa]